jgi:hypothetical protein
MRKLALLALAACLGCASAPPASESGRRVMLAHDDGKPDGTIAFPNPDYEGVLRFELPAGEHRLARLWIHAAAPGTIRWALYEQTELDTPGKPVAEGNREVTAADVCDGRAGVWLTQDLAALGVRKGVLWAGVRKVADEPTIWASSIATRAYYVRSVNPRTPTDLLPVKRVPHVRLELQPR